MAQKLSDVLDAARVLTADVAQYERSDLIIKKYPGDKVRIMVRLPGEAVNPTIAGDAHPEDAANAKRVIGKIVSQAKVDEVFKAVVELASADVKLPAKTADQSG